MDYRKRNRYLVFGGIIVCTVVIVGLSLALAIRDAENTVDFVFKLFGAAGAFLMATVGPFGMVGCALMSGKLGDASIKVTLLFSLFLSVLLLVYVCDQLDVVGLFR